MNTQKVIVILFISFLCLGCQEEIDRKELVERKGVLYKVNSEKGFTGVVVEKYDNGQKESEGTYKNGELDGVETTWLRGWGKFTEKNYKDGELNGTSTVWYDNGQKSYEKSYKDGELNGVSTSWYKNGQKKTEETLKDGKLEGRRLSWTIHGYKTSEKIYKNGLEIK